jgi:hypothetical protein
VVGAGSAADSADLVAAAAVAAAAVGVGSPVARLY